MGGDFKQGMFNGAWTAGFGYLFNCELTCMVVVGFAIVAGGYTAWNGYVDWRDFNNKLDSYAKKDDEWQDDPINEEKYMAKEEAFYDAYRQGVKAGSTIPGTSITGPPPSGALDVIQSGVTDYIQSKVKK